jgi:hypothetical protein
MKWIWPLFRDGNWPCYGMSRTRLRSSGKLARPYIWRLIIFSRLTLPSAMPEFQDKVSPPPTAWRSHCLRC